MRNKNEGNLSKLDPLYSGRYTVKRITDGGNYILAIGDIEQPTSYPAHKLQIIEEDDPEEESWEIESIIDKRTTNGTIEYLVRWSPSSTGESFPDEWLEEEKIDSTEIIQEFNDRLAGKKIKRKYKKSIIPKIRRTNIGKLTTDATTSDQPPPQQSVQVRRSTRSSAAKNINLAFMILQILLMLAGCYTMQVDIKEEFILCDRSRSQYIDIENMCDLNLKLPEKMNTKDFDRVFNNTDPELNRTATMLYNKYRLPTEPSQYQFYYDDRWPLP